MLSLLLITDCYAKNEPVTLSLWEFSANEQIMRGLIDRFESQNPDIKVNLQQLTWEYGLDKILISLAAGNAPDVCELGSTWLSKFAPSGVLLDLTGNTIDIKEKYFLWEAASYNGKIYGIPWLAGTRALFYNKDLFIKAGLDPDSPPTTWNELLRAAKAIHNPRKGAWGFSVFVGEPESPWQEFLPFAWANGAKILSDDLKKPLIDSKETLEALTFYKKLSDYSLIERQAQVNEMFAEGKIGMQISGSWNLRLIPRINPQLRFGVAQVPSPTHTAASGSAFGGSELFVITKNSKHPKEALRLIRFLADPKTVMAIVRVQQNVVPAQKEALLDPFYANNPEQKTFLDQLNTAQSPPNHPRWNEMQESITSLVEEVVMKDTPADEALHSASAKIGSVLNAETKRKTISDKITLVVFFFIITAAGVIAYTISRKEKISKGILKSKKPIEDRNANAYLYISPWLITLLVFGVYPLLYSLVISFSKYDMLTSGFNFVGLKNYYNTLLDREFRRALWHTLVFCAGTVPFTIGIALFCAVLINRKIPFKQIYQAGLFLPVTISVVVIATVFTYLYSTKGLANMVLDYFGIIHKSSSWLNNPKSWFGISVPLLSIMAMNIWASFGYYTVLFLAGLQTIPENLMEAASLDGAGEWQKFRHVTLPQLKPIILLAVVLNTIYSLQVFPEIFTMTMGGPLGSTTTAVYYLYDKGFHKFDLGGASSVAYILSVIIMLFSLLQMKLLSSKGREGSR